MNNYDQMPYISNALATSSPERTSAVGILFGMTPEKIQKANILEIGCASGGNLIPIAARYPKSSCMGIDISEIQIASAQETSDELGLKNVTLIAKSITDFDFSDKKFDYIIAHGVYSWVSSSVQDRLLEICGKNLSKNGIAYISYNTLPGWNSVKTVRDMMLYHSSNFTETADKISEARRMLAFAHDNIPTNTGAYELSLSEEIANTSKLADSHLFHDLLGEVNEPCYFHDFMASASEHGLSYLGDSRVPSMFVGNQTKEAAELLSEITDIVKQEQYSDFLTNRRFRTTLLVRNDVELNRNLNVGSLSGLSFRANYSLSENIKNLREIEELKLTNLSNPEITAVITGTYLCGIYVQILLASPSSATRDSIIKAADALFEEASITDLEEVWDANILNFIFNGMLEVESSEVQPETTITDMPCALPLARYQALSSSQLTNLKHQMIELTDSQRLLLPLVNGKHKRSEIIDEFCIVLDEDGSKISKDGLEITPSSPDFEAIIGEQVDLNLRFFLNNSLLVS
jgi:methyltransferase-like protein/SAM-dependent methyltransferase